MKTSVCLLLALAAFVQAVDIKKDRGVLVLEKDTFEAAVTENKHVLVEFCKYSSRHLNVTTENEFSFTRHMGKKLHGCLHTRPPDPIPPPIAASSYTILD